MHISLATSCAAGFKKWSVAHPPPSNDDDYPAGATPIALAPPSFGEEETHCPWLVPGIGASL